MLIASEGNHRNPYSLAQERRGETLLQNRMRREGKDELAFESSRGLYLKRRRSSRKSLRIRKISSSPT
ncbi:hypothetical protein LINPERHAP1_LOCUS9873 [Linum perenne]